MTVPHLTSRIPPSSRVLVIGLDGATYDVLVPFAETGVMPNLATLLREAALHQLRSTEPYTTPVAWTSFLTGCDVQSHGIFDYRYLDAARGELLLNHSGRIARPTLFHDVASAGGEVVSLSLPMTFPPPAGVPGIVVGGLDSPSGAAALRPYPQFAARLWLAGANYSVETIWKRKPTSFDELAAGVARTISDFDDHVTAARVADELTDWRLMVVQFQTLDSFQHRCWNLLARHSESSEEPSGSEPRRTPPESSWVREAQRAMHALDHCLGQLIELADRRRAAVVVLGDHGFGPFREKIYVNEVLRQRGLQRPASHATAWRRRAARTTWKLRKWLHRRTQRGSTAAVRRPLEALAPLDWRRTAAFAVHGELAALVYLNDAERFGRGPISSPRQREQAEADAVAAFREARHPATGEALFEDTYALREHFGCDPIVRGWPDVIAIPAPGFHTRSKFDGASSGTAERLLRHDRTLVGTHRRETVLIVRAPPAPGGAAPGGAALGGAALGGAAMCTRQVAEMRDVAPTILGLLGLPPGKSMTGSCVADLRQDSSQPHSQSPRAVREAADGIEFRHQRRARRSAPQTGHGNQAASTQELTGRDREVVEGRLRDLGYLE